MRPVDDIQSLSEFRKNTAALISQVRETRRPLILTQHGRSAAVVLDVEEYQRLVDRADLLAEVQAGEEELSRGEGISHEEARRSLIDRLSR